MKTKLMVASVIAALLAAGCQEAKADQLSIGIGYSSGGHRQHGHGHRGGYGYGGYVNASPMIYNNAYPIDPYRGYRVYPTVVYSAPVVIYSDPVAGLQALCRPGVSKVESGNITVHCNN